MFYSYDLLCLRKKGRYSIIWYAATHGSPPRKMDLARVSIAATCEELMDAIKIPAKKKNEPLRLSLYLSSMLMHGACIVYREQVILLLHDTMHFMEKFHQSAASKIAILMRNMDKREGEMADEERRGKRAGAPRRNKREMARDAAAVPELPELAPPPPPGLDEEAVMRQLEAQAQSAPPKALPLFLEPQEDAARTRALGLELAQAAQPLPGAQHELFSTTDPRLLAQIVELEGASRAGEREPMAEEKEKAEVQEEEEEEKKKEEPTVLEEVAAAAPVAMSTPLPLLAPPPATVLPALEIEPVPEQFPAAGEASKAPSEAEVAVGLAEQQEAEQVPPPATPTRRPAPPLGHPEAPPRKRPRLFPRCPAFSEDEETRWHRHVLAELPPPTRVAGADGDVAAAPAPAAAATVAGAAAWSSRFDDLRRAQEFVRVRRRLSSPTHAADASTEFALHASSRAGSFSHLSSVSMDQSEIKRIQGQLKAIPELGDATTSSLLQPVREDAAEEAAAGAVGGVEPPPEAPELPPPAEVPAPMEVDEPAPAPLPADVSELPPPPPEEQPVILEELQPPDLVAAREYETLEQLQPHLSPRTNWELSRQTILEKLHKLWLSGNGATTFDHLCPRAVPRVRVAVTFNILLHLHKDKTLKLQQEHPFETICIHKE